MTEEEFTSAFAELDAEAAALRATLGRFEETIHGKLKAKTKANLGRIEAIERQIRQIVLRLCEIEREQIELRVSKAM